MRTDLMARLVGNRATGTGGAIGAGKRTIRRPSFDLVIVISSRPHDLSMAYFDVTLGSLVGLGVYTGTIHVSFNGAAANSGYIEDAARGLGATDRLLVKHLPRKLLDQALEMDLK